MTAISAAASGDRTNAGTLSGSFSMAMPLTHSWPVAPHAQPSAAGMDRARAKTIASRLRFIRSPLRPNMRADPSLDFHVGGLA